MKEKLLLLLLFCFMLIGQSLYSQKPYEITIDLKNTSTTLHPLWAYFGYDEPNYTYMKDGKKLLSEIAALSPVPVYVRAHNLLTTGDGSASPKWGSTNAYTEDEKGNPVYHWNIIDSIFDTYLKRGMRPIAEIGFMPEDLSTHPQPYRHQWKAGTSNPLFTGWAYPPKDYKKWGELIYQWVTHCVQKYGEAEVKTWWWEVWNEPNIGYWQGTPEEYFMLYDYAVDAVKRACPKARVGGPTTTGPGGEKAGTFLKNFLIHCAEGKNYATGKTGAPLEYISFHAKGSPKIVDGHVRMNMATELNDIAKGCEIVAASAFKTLPIIIGECDPEGCAACGMTTSPENAYRNGTMYSSYTAASFARIYDIAKRYNVNIEGAVSWSFEFENQRWFDGFRDLATNGIDKPVLNVFRMFGMMNKTQVVVDNPLALPLDTLIQKGVHGNRPDIDALASADKKGSSIMLWNYKDDDVPVEATEINITIKNVSAKKVMLQQFRIDKDHSNAYEAWKKMGSPQSPTSEQYAELEKTGQLQTFSPKESLNTANGEIHLHLSLPGQAVSLLKLSY